tara:strand:+ start:13273 stop:13722 length:450 start_codon:yes stop_codon:yes gene_type:complete
VLTTLLYSCAQDFFVIEEEPDLFLNYKVSRIKTDKDRKLLSVSDPYRNLSGILKTAPKLYAFYYCMEKQLGFPILGKGTFLPDPKNPGHKMVNYKFSCSAHKKDLKGYIFSKVYNTCMQPPIDHPDIHELCHFIDKKYKFKQVLSLSKK